MIPIFVLILTQLVRIYFTEPNVKITSASSSSGRAAGSRKAAVSTPSRRVDERVGGAEVGGIVDRQLVSLSNTCPLPFSSQIQRLMSNAVNRDVVIDDVLISNSVNCAADQCQRNLLPATCSVQARRAVPSWVVGRPACVLCAPVQGARSQATRNITTASSAAVVVVTRRVSSFCDAASG